jgi:Family of unknown function (DUF6644)
MSLAEWCQWLEQTPTSTAIAESIWLFPLIEGSHILTLPLSVGMIMIFDLRLLGLTLVGSRGATVMHDMLRWSKFGFAVMFVTGGLLFMCHAGRAYENPFFRAKMIFLVMLGINAAVYQVVFYPKMPQWDAGRTPSGAKFCALLSLIVWIGVIVCGRTMAYQF